MDIIDESIVRIDPLPGSLHKDMRGKLAMLRLDLLHPIISGNKWYKLKYSMEAARQRHLDTLLSFGGAWSNHLIALAAAAKQHHLRSVGMVRGLQGHALTPVLRHCKELGMELHFLSRAEYDLKEDAGFIDQLQNRYGPFYLVPEGGANEQGRQGAEDIASLIPTEYTHVCISVGTGTTMAGLRSALAPGVQLLGFAPMKGGAYLAETILPYLKTGHTANWRIFDRWHLGGFGKYNEELIAFMNEFYTDTGVPLDLVYTGKMMMAVSALLEIGYFPNGAQVLCIHTGGLTGNASIAERLRFPTPGLSNLP